MTPLNGPLEVGLRVLFLLAEGHPARFDIARLVLLDYALLHSGEFDGPESIHPEVPLRQGELGVKRNFLQQGLEVLVRTELAELTLTDSGLVYSATESAPGFLNLLEGTYARALALRAAWVVDRFSELPDDALRAHMRGIQGAWSEEFHVAQGASAQGGPA